MRDGHSPAGMPVIVRRFVLLLGLAVAVGAVPPPPAASAKEWHKASQRYVNNWVFRSNKLNRCVFVSVSGRMVGRWRYAYGENSPDRDTLEWARMRLKNPTVSATGWPILGAGCDSTKRWKMRADLSQGFYQSGCDLDVSVSVGFPWSVSASPSYACGNNRVGHRTSTEGPARSTLTQFNSGFPIRFGGTLASVRAGGVGFTGVFTVRAHTKRSSDAIRRSLNITLNK